jgi:16S rRNA (cytidine1402-2'-O)-methyltransferase
VATPLGNALDLSPRAARILGEAGLILAEDTRRTGRLLAEAGVACARLVSLHEHNEAGRVAQALEFLAGGGQAALVSDAGTPLLSDPGFTLVRACRAAGVVVAPVPGPCAVTAALSASGLAPYPFTFLGFLPRKSGDVTRLFAAYAALGQTLVFFERKDRLAASLALAAAVLGDREFVVAREMTKTFEEFIPGRLFDLSVLERELLGEITVVIGPAAQGVRHSEAEAAKIHAREAAAGGKPREVARRAAGKLSGWSATEVYERFFLAGKKTS